MITKGGLFHEAKSSYSYGYDNDTLHIRFRALKGEVKKAICRIGDPYVWEKGGGGGNLNAEDAYGWIGADNYDMVLESTTTYHDYFFIEVPQDTKRNRYAFILEDNNNNLILFTEKKIIEIESNDPAKTPQLSVLENFFCFPYLNGIDVLKAPEWVKETVWYQIFPERFDNGDTSNDPDFVEPWGTAPTNHNYMGGDIQGVINHLDYLADLGISGLYFCPVFHGEANHKYQTLDYMNIDPMFGTNEKFKELVDKAHEKGIKIMLDAVFNHCGDNHPYFLDVKENGTESKYYDWFCINETPVKPGTYETFASVSQMPKINLENPEAAEYFLEVGRYWIREYGIDGWRLDVANEIGHAFWRRFRDEVKDENPDTYIVGEVWHDAHPWLKGDQFDAVMHYPLMNACLDYFVNDSISGDEFKSMINHINVNYPRNITENSFNLLDSHDTDRLLTKAKGNKTKMKLAYTYLFTHAGSPMIYYGDEVGMAGDNSMHSEAHRACFDWDQSTWDMDLLNFFKEIIHIRNTHKDLRRSTIDWLDTSVDGLIAYKKGNLICFINKSEDLIDYTLPDLIRSKYTSATDVRTDEALTLSEIIQVPAGDYKIITL